MIRRLSALLLAAAAALPCVARAQAVGPTPPVTPQLDFSGSIFGNFQYRTDSASKAAFGQKSPNKFDIERVYLNFRMPAGENGSIRVTTDVTTNANGNFYNGWAVRLKYAYFQYAFNKSVLGRVGMLHTVIIDHEESFWPRWIAKPAVELSGFFLSADVGVASLVTLPSKNGEIYATITNGTGYNQVETDRFKDFAARLSWTPFGKDSGLARTFTVVPWFSKGWVPSARPDTFTDGLRKDRYGVFAGVKDRRLSGGVEWAQRADGQETLVNIGPPQFPFPPPSRTVTTRKGTLIDGFAVVRPAEWANAARKSPLGLIARYDLFKPNTSADAQNRLLILGAFWDVNARMAVSLDYQGTSYSGYTTAAPAPPVATTIFAHWTVTF
jgi:hypothetical protein